jgi:hypothetical protein
MIKRVQIEGNWFKVSEKTGRLSKVPLTRCSNTMTESEYKAWVLGGLANMTRKWKPANDAWKINTRVKPKDVKGAHRIEHQCAHCLVWGPKKTRTNKWGMELDHIVPKGGLSDFSKTEQWIERAFVEIEGYQKLCTDCHRTKTNEEKKNG